MNSLNFYYAITVNRNDNRRYNATFVAKVVNGGNLMHMFKVQGQVHNLVGFLLSLKMARESFSHIYLISEYIQQRDARMRCSPNSSNYLLESLKTMLDESNRYIHDFQTVFQTLPPNPNEYYYKIFINAHRCPLIEHRRHLNEAKTNELYVLLLDQRYD